MKEKKIINTKGSTLTAVFCIGLLFGCQNKNADDSNNLLKENAQSEKVLVTKGAQQIAVEPPPLTDGIFPCMDCHSEIDPNSVRRKLVDMHDDITAIFNHDNENRWCLDCHDSDSRDSIRLASGKLLDFTESYKLCGQCHGDKLRDWKVGVHGKRTGEWNGKKEYLLCVHCHNPHSPKFKQLTPDPPPLRQEDI